jgi:type IV secretory pathway TrbD component
MSRSLFAGLIYFALVFGVGFALGTLRVLVIIPLVGVRTAELIEFPIMLAVSYMAAKRVIKWLAVPPTMTGRIEMGAFALILLLAAEFGFVLWLRGMSLAEYFETRDPLTGTIYYVSLIIFAAMPVILVKTGRR